MRSALQNKRMSAKTPLHGGFFVPFCSFMLVLLYYNDCAKSWPAVSTHIRHLFWSSQRPVMTWRCFMIKENVSLKSFNTFKTGGEARYFAEINLVDELPDVLQFAKEKRLPVLVLGGGSNILVSDNGFPGLVIKISLKGIEWLERDEEIDVVASAGESWDKLVEQSVSRGLYGLENLSGIPGTAGAAPVQNIGAYGSEIKNHLSWVEVFDMADNKIKKLSKEDCRFSYRGSIFKELGVGSLIITRVCFSLKKKGALNLSYKDLKEYFLDRSPSLKEVREAVINIRGRKFPDLNKFGTAGSFFKNPIVSREKLESILKNYPDLPYFENHSGEFKIPAAWILDKVFNLRGKIFGQVEFFKDQPLVVVNLGEALSSEIKNTTDKIIKDVKEKTGITLEREIILVGEFDF